MITGSLKHLLISFNNKYISDEQFMNGLMVEFYTIIELNNLCKNEKEKFLRILAKIDINYDVKYNKLYFKLALIPDLWSLPSRANMPLINYICYGYNEMFFDCIYELTQYSQLWSLPDDRNGYTALHFLTLLLKNFNDYSIVPIIEQLLKNSYLWSILSNSQETPLHILCSYKKKIFPTVLEYLTEYEELWKIPNSKGMTPLHYLCNTNDYNNALDIFMKLADFKEIWECKDELNYTPLHILCRNINDNMYDCFFSKMRKNQNLWNIQNASGQTPDDIFREQFVIL
jgi:hypothetical protein